MQFLIPIISSFCFRSGGAGRDDIFCPAIPVKAIWANKWWRWLGIGLTIALITKAWLVIPAYFIVTNCMPYGEKSWLNFLGKDLKWIIYGGAFGSCSFFSLPFGFALISTLLGGFSFWFLMKWSNDGFGGNLLDHSYVELGFGFIGTICFLMA